MAESKSHKATASRIARKYGVEYNSTQGVDVVSPDVAFEVEPQESVRDGIPQLQGYRKRANIAGTNAVAVEAALEATDGVTNGVMDSHGRIVKHSTR